MERIYIVGDSHVSVFSGRDVLLPKWPTVSRSLLPDLQPIHLGPITAHNWNSESSSSGGRKLFSEFVSTLADQDSHILLSAGEIDCRAHLLKKAAEDQRLVSDGVNATIRRYMEFLERLRGQGFRISVLSPPATSFREIRNPDFPFHGSERERNAITRLFTERLRAACEKKGFAFLDQFSFTVDSSGLSRRSFYWDGVHLGTAALPRLVSEMRALFGTGLRIPLRWHLRESARGFKKLFGRTR